MSAFRLAAGSIGLAIGAAVVTALAASPEVKPPAPPPMIEAKAATEAKAPPAAAKSDRLAIRRAKPGPVTSAWACPQEPWPYGCQWRSPTRKVLRPSRPS
jgi:hypothetical protein